MGLPFVPGDAVKSGPVLSEKPALPDGRRPPILKDKLLKDKHCNAQPMPMPARHIATLLAAALAGFVLSGCGTINEKLAAGISDSIPAWAGGLPADAPPRPGTAKYDEFMKERERKRLEPAQTTATDAASKSNASLDPVH